MNVSPPELSHGTFRELPSQLTPGDLVVVNASATRKAALVVSEALMLHVSTRLATGAWIVELRRRVGVGTLPNRSASRARCSSSPAEPGRRFSHPTTRIYRPRYGRRRSAFRDLTMTWRPTSRRTGELERRSIEVAPLLLHCGVSSQDHGEAPHDEYYRVPDSTLDAIPQTRARDGRVVAVGTTVVRALESVELYALEGWTDLVISESHRIRWVDGIVSGFHPPDASHLSLLRAVVGRDALRRAYRAAHERGYTAHEFGDFMLGWRSSRAGRGGMGHRARSK